MTVSFKGYRRWLALLIGLLLLLAAFAPGMALSDGKDDEDADTEATETENPFSPLVFDDPGTPPSEVAEEFGDISPRLRLEAYPIHIGYAGAPEQWKFTLYGTEGLLTQMKDALTEKEEPFPFLYSLEVQGEQTFSFEGSISYGVAKGETFAGVTRFQMVVHVGDYRYLNGVHCKRSADNQLSWHVEMPKSAHFDINKVSGYKFSIYTADHRHRKLVYTFAPDIQADTALYTPMRRGAALRIDMPTAHDMALTIIDPRLPDGYTNSPEKKGDIMPYWHIKVVLSALEWFEIKLDGTYGEAMDSMKFYCGHYLRETDDSNKYSPKSNVIETVGDCSYTINGEQIAFALKYPDGRPVDFTYIDYITVDMSNGRTFRVNRYPMF